MSLNFALAQKEITSFTVDMCFIFHINDILIVLLQKFLPEFGSASLTQTLVQLHTQVFVPTNHLPLLSLFVNTWKKHFTCITFSFYLRKCKQVSFSFIKSCKVKCLQMLMLHVATIMIDQRFCYESLSVKSNLSGLMLMQSTSLYDDFLI